MASVADPSVPYTPETASVPLPVATCRTVEPMASKRPEKGRRGTRGRGRGRGLSLKGRSIGRGFGRGRRVGASANGDHEDPSYGWTIGNYDCTDFSLENKFAEEILHQCACLLCRIAVNKIKLECSVRVLRRPGAIFSCCSSI